MMDKEKQKVVYYNNTAVAVMIIILVILSGGTGFYVGVQVFGARRPPVILMPYVDYLDDRNETVELPEWAPSINEEFIIKVYHVEENVSYKFFTVISTYWQSPAGSEFTGQKDGYWNQPFILPKGCEVILCISDNDEWKPVIKITFFLIHDYIG